MTARRRCALALIAGWVFGWSHGETAEKKFLEISVQNGKVYSAAAERAGGFPVIRVRQGEALALRWKADVAMTIHLHGYDIEARVPRQGEATMDFVARAAGRFPIERHGRDGHATLLYLEVRP